MQSRSIDGVVRRLQRRVRLLATVHDRVDLFKALFNEHAEAPFHIGSGRFDILTPWTSFEQRFDDLDMFRAWLIESRPHCGAKDRRAVHVHMRRQGPERDPVPQVFVSLAQNPPRSVDLFIRTSSDDPLSTAGALRAAVRRVEKNAPLYGVAPLEQQFGTYFAERRFQTWLLTAFSAVALLMAAVGIYGLIHYSVATRTREIGIRMAVGGRSGDIFHLIVREGLQLSGAGLMLGLIGAFFVGRVGSNLLFGVTAADPLTFTAVSLLFTAVSVAASYLPARRAMKVDPVVALRQE